MMNKYRNVDGPMDTTYKHLNPFSLQIDFHSNDKKHRLLIFYYCSKLLEQIKSNTWPQVKKLGKSIDYRNRNR